MRGRSATVLAAAAGAAVLAVALAASAAGPPPPPPESQRMVPGRRAGFVVADNTGCWVWMSGVPAGAEGIALHWDGACPEGPADGPGRAQLRWRDAGSEWRMVYEGTLRGGKAEGQGRLTGYDNGEVAFVQEGRFRDDHLASGRVELPRAGLVYEGGWLGRHPHGRGRATAGGRLFEGEWVQGCLRTDQGWIAFTRPVRECEARPT